MNTPSRAIPASRGGIKTVEIVAFVGIAGALDIPARLLYTKHRKGAAGQTVVPLVLVTEVTASWGAVGGYFFLLSVIPFDLNDLKDQSNNTND